jgi:hypothetical protein
MIKYNQPTTMLLFDCLFDDYGVSDHHRHEYDFECYLELPDLYALCVIDEQAHPEKMVAAMMIKTDVPFEDDRFLDGVVTIIGAVPHLRAVSNPHTTVLPVPVEAGSPIPMSQVHALDVFRQLWAEHQTTRILRMSV